MKLKLTFFFTFLSSLSFSGGGYSEGAEYIYLAAFLMLVVLLSIGGIIKKGKQLLFTISSFTKSKIAMLKDKWSSTNDEFEFSS